MFLIRAFGNADFVLLRIRAFREYVPFEPAEPIVLSRRVLRVNENERFVISTNAIRAFDHQSMEKISVSQ